MSHKTGNISKLRVGEVGEKIVNGKGGMRRITMKRIKTTGFPQFVVLKNEPV